MFSGRTPCKPPASGQPGPLFRAATAPLNKKATPKGRLGSVIPARLERATHSLEGCCSIQLSYGTSIGTAKIVKISEIKPD